MSSRAIRRTATPGSARSGRLRSTANRRTRQTPPPSRSSRPTSAPPKQPGLLPTKSRSPTNLNSQKQSVGSRQGRSLSLSNRPSSVSSRRSRSRLRASSVSNRGLAGSVFDERHLHLQKLQHERRLLSTVSQLREREEQLRVSRRRQLQVQEESAAVNQRKTEERRIRQRQIQRKARAYRQQHLKRKALEAKRAASIRAAHVDREAQRSTLLEISKNRQAHATTLRKKTSLSRRFAVVTRKNQLEYDRARHVEQKQAERLRRMEKFEYDRDEKERIRKEKERIKAKIKERTKARKVANEIRRVQGLQEREETSFTRETTAIQRKRLHNDRTCQRIRRKRASLMQSNEIRRKRREEELERRRQLRDEERRKKAELVQMRRALELEKKMEAARERERRQKLALKKAREREEMRRQRAIQRYEETERRRQSVLENMKNLSQQKDSVLGIVGSHKHTLEQSTLEELKLIEETLRARIRARDRILLGGVVNLDRSGDSLGGDDLDQDGESPRRGRPQAPQQQATRRTRRQAGEFEVDQNDFEEEQDRPGTTDPDRGASTDPVAVDGDSEGDPFDEEMSDDLEDSPERARQEFLQEYHQEEAKEENVREGGAFVDPDQCEGEYLEDDDLVLMKVDDLPSVSPATKAAIVQPVVDTEDQDSEEDTSLIELRGDVWDEAKAVEPIPALSPIRERKLEPESDRDEEVDSLLDVTSSIGKMTVLIENEY